MALPRLNLRGVTALLADRDHYTRDLIAHMLRGFGMESPVFADSGASAMAQMKHCCYDLCIVEAMLPDMSGAELVRWIRQMNKAPMRFMPVLVLTGYTQLRMIAETRDAGANIIAKKPISPKVLFERIAWMARVARPFIETDSYVGPDRRFRDIPPPEGNYKRETDIGGAADGAVPPEEPPSELSARIRRA